LPDVSGRRRAVFAAILAAVVLASALPAVTQASAPAGLERFLFALGRVESGGNYRAHNASSGAYGKYQIIPASWAAWAAGYLGDARAPQTPRNQETVAHRKVSSLYRWLDSWSVVAHWWLTGSGERNPRLWSSFSRTYVAHVIRLMRGGSAGSTGGSSGSSSGHGWIDSKDQRLGDGSAAIHYGGTWATARYAKYSNHRVKYATRVGASATLAFTGTGIAWVGPTGPTRGAAKVYVDGRLAGTVQLRTSSFDARKVLFSRHWSASGSHTIRIVVTTNGRPVAIDDLIVGT
jgi:transglycosylase-like protein